MELVATLLLHVAILASAIVAVITGIKHSVVKLGWRCLDSQWGQWLLYAAPFLLGIGGAAAWPDFGGAALPTVAQACLGVSAGFNAEWLYRRAKARASALMLGKEARRA